jgi:hypothetical protein
MKETDMNPPIDKVNTGASQMIIDVPPHKGETAEFVLLTSPYYVAECVLTLFPNPLLRSLTTEFERLISIFDAKPILKRCHGQGCEDKATRVSICRDNIAMLQWWCDACDPCQTGAARGRIQIVRTYREALLHVQQFCNDRKRDYWEFVGELARAKGLPKNYTDAHAKIFLAE